MGLMRLIDEDLPRTAAQQELLSQFFQKTGYGPSDLLSLSFFTRTFLTRNGGKYQLRENGGIAHLAGPAPDPSDRI